MKAVVKRKPRQSTTALKKRACAAYAESGTITAAMATVKRHRSQWSVWIKNDPAFKAMADEADEIFTDGLETVAAKRGRDKSDTLLIFMLKARRPDIYRETVQYQVRGEIDHHHTLELKLASMVPPDVALALQNPNTFRELIDKATAKPIDVGKGSTVEEK